MKRQRIWVFFGILLLLVGLGGLFWDKLQLNGFSSTHLEVPFLNSKSREEARQQYKEAMQAFDGKDYQTAAQSLEGLKDCYSVMRPLILLNLAKAYEQLGEEGKVQAALETMTRETEGSPLQWSGLYTLGQSAMRSRNWELAEKSFKALIEKSPASNLTLGAHYYLGGLADLQNNPELAAREWRIYLDGAPDGTFSDLAAKGLAKVQSHKTAEDHRRIGLVYYHQEQWAKALPHLQKAAYGDVWVELGRTLMRTGNAKVGLQTLEKGLHMTDTPKRTEAAINAIMAASSNRKAKLQQILNTNPKSGGDYLLWQLQKLSLGAERAAYGQQLLVRYPDSKWAPETSWEQMWPLCKNGQSAAFLAKADQHLTRYPHSVSAPRVLFWKAKTTLNQGNTEEAQLQLKKLVGSYPNQYYAFRAQQILVNSDAPWATDPQKSYPPQLDDEVFAKSLAGYVGYKKLVPTLAETIQLGEVADIQSVLTALPMDALVQPLNSLVHRLNGENAQSIRVIRDYLDERRKEGKTVTDTALQKLLYPVLFTEQIHQHAAANHLDPYLVQALTRQESYFNPFAVSSSNAMGLMQLLPSTAKGVAEWEKLSGFATPSLFNPDVNIRLGTRYLRYLHQQFGGNSMLAVGGYNGGPGAMGRWVKASPVFAQDPDMFVENIPALQTRDYVKEVFSHYWNYLRLYNP